jgi:ribosomal-protein-alanine N-acetyltransferase
MNITTDRLFIRKAEFKDADAIFKAVECPQISQMHSFEFTSINKVRDYIIVLEKEYKAGIYRTMAVTDRINDELLGLLTLDKDSIFPRAEISYWVDITHRNMGYATEAVRAVINFCFNNMDIKRIQAMHFTGNNAWRVLFRRG